MSAPKFFVACLLARELGDPQSPQQFYEATPRHVLPCLDKTVCGPLIPRSDLLQLRVDLRALAPPPKRVGCWPPLRQQLYVTVGE